MQPSEKIIQTKSKIPPKPAMAAEATAYPKLLKIYKELKRQNEIIFDAKKECNAWELEREDLKRLARFTKKGELQSKINRKNEEIDILKIGLLRITKRYGFPTVHDLYKVYHYAENAFVDYQDKATKLKEAYGENVQVQKKENIHEQIQNYSKIGANCTVNSADRHKKRGAR